jgi:hypothetical protein
MISVAILAGKPDELQISLDAVSDLSDPGVRALMSGYVVAIDYGTRYRVRGARNQVRAGLRALGILDALNVTGQTQRRRTDACHLPRPHPLPSRPDRLHSHHSDDLTSIGASGQIGGWLQVVAGVGGVEALVG